MIEAEDYVAVTAGRADAINRHRHGTLTPCFGPHPETSNSTPKSCTALGVAAIRSVVDLANPVNLETRVSA